ncbi:hypothetical protein OEZ85_005316 [Tetradesmus obliquus]|uniref:C2 domain-containing protein n=1 Tax=Tetradesmus obliquus TaxID=3088 RepID=A0ABY8UHH7_TETOB|nr:hypothetical protein OEZ85_005316 [Tetradesmus obliquus]
MSAPDADALSEVSVGAAAGSSEESSFLVIHVHEARNLVAKDYETNSSHPFVKVTLGQCTKKTRTIFRNTHPLFEQQLAFALDGVPEEEPLHVELHGKQFLGQVVMTLGKAIEIASDAALGQNYWFGLSKRCSTDIVGGELCLGFRVLDAVSYVNLAGELDGLMDNDRIAKALASKALRVQLHGINGLLASGLIKGAAATAAAAAAQLQAGAGKSAAKQRPSKGLSLFIKYGRLTMEKPLPELPDEAADSSQGYELAVHEEVLIPLAAAVRAPPPLAPRSKDELFDVKLYIKSGSTTIAKTQIPVWDIPLCDKPSSSACTPIGPAGSAATEAVARATRTSMESAPSIPGSLQLKKAASVALSGLQARSSDSLGSESAPGTPRRRLSIAAGGVAAALGLASPSKGAPPASAFNAAAQADDFGVMRSSKSEAVLTRLAPQSPAGGCGSAGCSPREMFVEGSLTSVTASSRAAHTTHHLGRKKVQGLSELHDFKSTMKSILIPPKEVHRMGWVPTAKGDSSDGDEPGQAPDVRLKEYRRLMESHVPMYAHLEIGIALGLEAGQQQPEAAGPATAVDDAGGQVLLDDDAGDDSEDVADASPITPPEAFDLVLQDVTLNIGVSSLYALLLGHNSDFMAGHYAAEEMIGMAVGPWKPGASGSGCLRCRSAQYTKKLNIPFAPKQCQVWEEHQVLLKQDGGWVAQHICTNDAPKGDCFRAMVQLVGVYVSSGKSRLRVSLKLDWHKNTLGKSLVQSGAESDSKRCWARLVASLQQHIITKGGLALPGTEQQV